MGTTSPELGTRALDALVEAGVEFAFLHREREAAAGIPASDYDLVARARTADEIIGIAVRAWADTPLRVAVTSEYDTGSVALWLATNIADHGVQVDFTYGTSPSNQFALSFSSWLSTAVPGDRYPTVQPGHEATYRARKAAFKGGTWNAYPRPRRIHDESLRWGRRLSRRTGYWIHLADGQLDLAETVAERFRRFLPIARSLDLHTTRRGSLARFALPVLYRPGLLVTCGGRRPIGADLTVETSNSVDEIASRAVGLMHARILSRLS